jgi:hypothetical protein
VRLLLVVTDSEAMRAFERGFLESAERGFTIAPRVFGRGRSGLRAGDRVHPGGSSLLFTVVADAEVESTLAFLKRTRDEAGASEGTKIYSLPVEDVS